MDSKHLIALAALALAGCATPDRVSTGWSHVSHPLLGWPSGPANEEDVLDVADVRLEWNRGRYRFEASLGYQLANGGFYGDDFLFMSRASYSLWSKK